MWEILNLLHQEQSLSPWDYFILSGQSLISNMVPSRGFLWLIPSDFGPSPLAGTLVFMFSILDIFCSENDLQFVCMCASVCVCVCLCVVVDRAELHAFGRQGLSLFFLWCCSEVPAITVYWGKNSNDTDQCSWPFLENRPASLRVPPLTLCNKCVCFSWDGVCFSATCLFSSHYN